MAIYNIHTGIKRAKWRISAAAMSLAALAIPAVLALSGSTATAATTYTLFGDASIVPAGNPGNAAQLVSDVAGPTGYAGVNVEPSTAIAWADLTTLSTDYNITDDDCGGGSPRVSVDVDTNGDSVADGTVHIALGPSPSFTDCASGWQNSGNLIGNTDAGRYDYSQFGGSPFTTYAGAPASVLAGDVLNVAVVVDGSWSTDATGGDGEQTVLVDNITVNSDVTTFDVVVPPEPVVPQTKDECKKGGWATFTDVVFKNQGDCVSYVATHGKNAASGN